MFDTPMGNAAIVKFVLFLLRVSVGCQQIMDLLFQFYLTLKFSLISEHMHTYAHTQAHISFEKQLPALEPSRLESNKTLKLLCDFEVHDSGQFPWLIKPSILICKWQLQYQLFRIVLRIKLTHLCKTHNVEPSIETKLHTVMSHITTLWAFMDLMYDSGPIRLQWVWKMFIA